VLESSKYMIHIKYFWLLVLQVIQGKAMKMW